MRTTTDLVTTRDAWHRLAEHVLAPARYAAEGRVQLRPGPGGFATPPFGTPPTTVAVEGAEVVVRRAGRESRCRPHTLREAAAFVGVRPGAVGTPSTTSDAPDEPLRIDPASAAELADWYRRGVEALAAFAPDAAAHLWPEHFDLAVVLGRANYGVPPGDDVIPEPYAYVGPWDPPDGQDPFFDRSFGAARPARDLPTADLLVRFFRTGREHLGGRR